MRKIVQFTLLTLSFSCLMQIGYSQNNKGLLTFKVHPSAVVNPGRPSLQFGVEFSPLKNLAIEYSYGFRIFEIDFGTNGFATNTNKIVTPRGYNHRLELKLYRKNDFLQNSFWSLGYWFIDDIRNKETTYWTNPGNDLITDNFAIYKKVHVLAISYGFVIKRERIIFEPSMGLGIRYRDQKLVGNEFELGVHSGPHGLLWGWEKSHHGLVPHFNIGLKIGLELIGKN